MFLPPQTINLFDGGKFSPHVNGYTVEIDYNAGRRNFVVDPEVKITIGFFVNLITRVSPSRSHKGALLP